MGIDVESTNVLHKPVPPCASGEGSPYAPVDWPNPGDVWTWKVGNKITPSGYYVHRSLIVPKSLQRTPTRKIWLGSKNAVIQFLTSEFPEADIDAFFASFTWEIPAEIGSTPEVKDKSSSVKDKSSTQKPVPEKKSVPEKTSTAKETSTPKDKSAAKQKFTPKEKPTTKEYLTPKIEAESENHIGRRTRRSGIFNQGSTLNTEEERETQTTKRKRTTENSGRVSEPKKESPPKKQGGSGSPIFRRTRNSTRKQISDQDAAVSTALALVEGASAGQVSPVSAVHENNHGFGLDVTLYKGKAAAGRLGSRRKQKESNSQRNDINEMSSEDFDNYLNSLDDILCPSAPKAPTLNSSLLETDEDFFARARAELSSLLSQDLSSLITSDKLPIVTDLSSRLRSDPDLTLEELSILDLILEIPLVSDHLQNVKEIKTEARKFFADLETNIALVSKLKNKYTLSKDKLAILEAENASNLPTIEEIDKQLAKLHSRRDELAKALEENEAQIADLSSTQKRILNSLPKIVNEVKTANTEKAEWEMKQTDAEKQESQILAKFAPIEGFSFIR